MRPSAHGPAAPNLGHRANEGAARGGDMAGWNPLLGSADLDFLPERDDAVARSRDVGRNTGHVRAGLRRRADRALGFELRLVYEPSWRALGVSREAVRTWARDVEARFRLYANDPGHYVDAARKQHFGGLLRLAWMHWVFDGDGIVLPLWLDRGGSNRTCFQVIDPDRLSTPPGQIEGLRMRSGVERDPVTTEHLAYWFRTTHPADIGVNTTNPFEWERIPRETSWGRPQVIHFFDQERADQTRGVPALVSALKDIRTTGRYTNLELAAAAVAAMYSFVISSPMDPGLLDQRLDVGGIGKYHDARMAYHDAVEYRIQDMVKALKLFPGETADLKTASRPPSAFTPFVEHFDRKIGSAIDLSLEELTLDGSKLNYSSIRGIENMVWRTIAVRTQTFGHAVATPMFGCWLEEEMESGRIEPPPGAPDFYEAKAAYVSGQWIGPARGYVDPEKEAKGQAARLQNFTTTLAQLCAEQGLDWEEVLDQRRDEMLALKDRGLAGLTGDQVAAMLQGTTRDNDAAAPAAD